MLISALTTEQFVLQAARSANVGEMTGRGPIYLRAVSRSLIALGCWPGSSAAWTRSWRGAAGGVGPGGVHLRRPGAHHPGEPGVVGQLPRIRGDYATLVREAAQCLAEQGRAHADGLEVDPKSEPHGGYRIACL